MQRIFISKQTQHIIGSEGQDFCSSVYFSQFFLPAIWHLFFRTTVRDSSVQETISDKICYFTHKDGGCSDLITWLSTKFAKS